MATQCVQQGRIVHTNEKNEVDLFKNFSGQRRPNLAQLTISTMPLSHDMALVTNKRNETTKIQQILDEAVSVTQEVMGDNNVSGDERDERDYEEDEDIVFIVPIKEDNYVSKRSMLSRKDTRRNELLLDDASAITNALRALQHKEDDILAELLSSDDEESTCCSDEESLADF